MTRNIACAECVLAWVDIWNQGFYLGFFIWRIAIEIMNLIAFFSHLELVSLGFGHWRIDGVSKVSMVYKKLTSMKLCLKQSCKGVCYLDDECWKLQWLDCFLENFANPLGGGFRMWVCMWEGECWCPGNGEFLIRVCFVIKKMWINTMLLLLILFICPCVCTYEPSCLMCAKVVGEMGLLFEFDFVDVGKKC